MAEGSGSGFDLAPDEFELQDMSGKFDEYSEYSIDDLYVERDRLMKETQGWGGVSVDAAQRLTYVDAMIVGAHESVAELEWDGYIESYADGDNVGAHK